MKGARSIPLNSAIMFIHPNNVSCRMRSVRLGSFVLVLLASGCWRSPSERVLDEFIAVNNSFDSAMAHRDSRTPPSLPTPPFAELGCPEFTAPADSLLASLDATEQRISALLTQLAGVPQDDKLAGAEAFDHLAAGPALFDEVARFRGIAATNPTDSLINGKALLAEHASAASWRADAFAGFSRASVVTMLAQLRQDLRMAKDATMNAMLNACFAKSK